MMLTRFSLMCYEDTLPDFDFGPCGCGSHDCESCRPDVCLVEDCEHCSWGAPCACSFRHADEEWTAGCSCTREADGAEAEETCECHRWLRPSARERRRRLVGSDPQSEGALVYFAAGVVA